MSRLRPEPSVEILIGDVRQKLSELADESVDCVVTSPPYWGLRDYGTGVWEGGDPDCDHVKTTHRRDEPDRARGWNGDFRYTSEPLPVSFGAVCGKCGANRVDHQIGLEATPEEYVETIVGVFREIHRVLSPFGTLWLNLGDSYNNYNGNRSNHGRLSGAHRGHPDKPAGSGLDAPDLKQKDLVGIPWMVAFALRADGWYLRSDVVWSKPNPMPESVTDRPTKSHEYVFMMSKQRHYFFDQEAVRERWADDRAGAAGGTSQIYEGTTPDREPRRRPTAPPAVSGRNVRSVWTISPEPFPGAHFAVMPKALAEKCIRAGAPREVCTICGTPRERIVDRGEPVLQPGTWSSTGAAQFDADAGDYVLADSASTLKHVVPTKTIGWTHCACAYGLELGELDVIRSPTGSQTEPDPSMEVGRAGMSRPRRDDEGVRPITRFEQRRYADQIKASPHRAEMDLEAGPAMAHYLRTDLSGARPVPADLLDSWIERGWIERVDLPEPGEGSYRRGRVLDPFLGAGTTAIVALRENRDAVGVELSEEYAAMARSRLVRWWDDVDVTPDEPAIEGQQALAL